MFILYILVSFKVKKEKKNQLLTRLFFPLLSLALLELFIMYFAAANGLQHPSRRTTRCAVGVLNKHHAVFNRTLN